MLLDVRRYNVITMSEILKNKKLVDQSHIIQDNLEDLLETMNKVRAVYGKAMIVTNCLRTMDEHLAIYARKGITDQSKIPMQSKHLNGLAIDISDPHGELNDWCKNNEELLIEIGVWLEERQGSWQHFQIAPFKSYRIGGTIWFKP
jgi:LAS superfamily LD-carboxypeptidase LdcB